jgi:hypothetical protein
MMKLHSTLLFLAAICNVVLAGDFKSLYANHYDISDIPGLESMKKNHPERFFQENLDKMLPELRGASFLW